MNASLVKALIIVLVFGTGLVAGRFLLLPGEVQPSAAQDSADDAEILYWVAPMDPNYRRDQPGKSPMGMDLVPVYPDDDTDGTVTISPTMVNNLGVRTAIAERSELPRTFSTVGYVSYDEDTVQHVHTRVEGWIEKLATKATGERVTKGQRLFELYSPTLVNAQEELLAAIRAGNAGLRAASRERLVALGVAATDIDRLERDREVRRTVPIRAAADGVVVHLGVREGIYVMPTTEVMAVAKLDSIWVIAEVFERQSDWVQPGQRATVELDYRPGETFSSTVDYVYPELDPVTRTLRVRLRLDNESEILRPNMFARVMIDGSGFGSVVHVPREAVIRGASGNRVVLDVGNGRFRVVPVVVGIESGARVAIRRGVKAGDRVVVSAQFLIDSESNVDSALSRMGPQQ